MALAAALKVLMAFLLAALKIPADGAEAVKQEPSESVTPSVETCEANSSITLKIPEKDSSAQFKCDKDFELYPKEPDQVYLKDCKTRETLSDMKRTDAETTGAETKARNSSEASKTYTLKAEKQPSKKTLCYVCAKKGTAPNNLGTAANYCTIYVESGARTQFDPIFTFVRVLPCVLAAFQFT